MNRNCCKVSGLVVLATLAFLGPARVETAQQPSESSDRVNQVLEWNQIFIDTLIATNTANSSSQRLGAIVHTAVFDAYNGIDGRYTPIFVHTAAPKGASGRAAVIAAAYTALVGLFPTQQPALDASYAASIAALSADCEHSGQPRGSPPSCPTRIERGIAWELKSHTPSSAGAPTMGSPRAIHRSQEEQPLASGGPYCLRRR